ncbi:alpha/beta hydrolase-fold protein [Halopseudomonas pachastrellae]|nr:alpha/beta hydrolase-fold protein [Halopseudomonas pachastrellae]
MNFLRRAWDFSPPVPEERNTPPQGGQDELINFLADKLMPAIAERFPVDADQQSLFGHSFGGMFAIHTLYQRPELFNHLVAASPSIWWNDRFLLVEERAFVEQANSGDLNLTHTSLALMLGERDSPQEIQDSQALQQRLAPLSSHGLRTSFSKPGEDHMSVPFKLVNRVLREVLTARQR